MACRRTTKKYIVNELYSSQKSSSKQRGHTPPSYTKEELREWLYSNSNFHTMYDNYKRLDFQSAYKPSVDRVDDSIGYTMSNIQLMTWGENREKAFNQYRTNEKIHPTSPQVSVYQYTKDKVLINTFHSIMEASRQTQVSDGHISKVINGKRKSAGGYLWEKVSK